MDKSELIIPVRFDYKNAAQELRKVERSGQLIGDTTAKSFQAASNADESFGSEIRELLHPQANLGSLDQAAGAISEPFQRTYDHIKDVSQENTSAPVSRLQPRLNRTMSQGFASEETAQAQSISSEPFFGDEEARVENTLKYPTNPRLQGQYSKLGILDGMTPTQRNEAAEQTPRQHEANDEGLNELMTDYAPNLPESGGLLGFMNQDSGIVGLEPLRGPGLETAPEFVEQPSRNRQDSTAGQSVQGGTRSASEKGNQGHQFRKMEQLHLESEPHLLESAWLTKLDWNPPAEELMPHITSALGQGANFRPPSEVRGRLGESKTARGDAASLETVAMTARLQELLERIAHSNERIARQAEDRPLAAPPPNPPGRM